MLEKFTSDWRYRFALLFLFLLPFERIPSHDVKGITIRATSLLILVFAVAILPGLLKEKAIKPRSAIDYAVIAFYLWGWVSVAYATDKHHAILVMLLWSFVLLGYLLVSRLWRKFFNPEAIAKTFITTGVVTALFGFYQFVGNTYFNLSEKWTLLSPNYVRNILGFARVQSVGVEPLYYAAFLFLPISFLAVRILRAKGLPKWTDTLSLIILTAAFVLTVSRGAYLGLIALCVVLLLILFLKKAFNQQVIILAVTMILGFGLSQGMVYLSKYFVPSGNNTTETKFVDHAIGGVATRESSVDPRIAAMQDAWHIYKQHPVTGVGIGNYGVVTTLQKTDQNEYPIVNNQYLETLTEMGPVGALLFACMLVAVLLKLWKMLIRNDEKSWFAVALALSVVGIGVQWNFFSTIYILLIWVLVGLVEAIPE